MIAARRWIFACLFTVAAAGCANPIYVVGMRFVYKRAALPEAQILHDVFYDPTTGALKQRLDLYVPAPALAPWPTVVFVHGGSWMSGDRGLEVGGQDVYGNIGRFLAGHGYGAAVISYRLVPEVDWRGQNDDVVKAIKWVNDVAPVYGARRGSIALMGHSAGAQLAARAAFDREGLMAHGVPPTVIRGLIVVSGAGYDLSDETTYDLGHDPAFYASVFRRSADETNWKQMASVTPLIRAPAKPVLLMHAAGESEPLKRQTALLAAALRAAGADPALVVPPGLSHTRIVPTLSREDRPAGAAVLAFLREVFAD